MKASRKLSKSLPPVDFERLISSEDSGIDSEISIASTDSCVLDDRQSQENGQKFLLGEMYSLEQRMKGISQAITWIKEELTQMKETDKKLIKQIISIRTDIVHLKQDTEETEDGKNLTVPKKSAPIGDSGYGSDRAYLAGGRTEEINEKNYILPENFPTSGHLFENNIRATWAI